jgi:apolipoprotein N-acyltransferase
VPILVVQGNNDLGRQWRPEFYGRGLEQYLGLTTAAAMGASPEVIVWPESAVTFFLAHEPRYHALVTRMLGELGADLIVGGPHYEDDDPARPRYFNSAFYLDQGGAIRSRYDKRRLLPFAEYFPLRTIGFLRRKFERVRTFTAGEGTTLLDTRMGKAAVVICFEAVFPELVRERMRHGAEVLVNLSNDVWLGGGAGPAQHLAMARLRAVENRTWLVRATTTGISAIVDPRGRVRAESGTFTAETLRGEVVPMQVDTVYRRFGDLFAWTCLFAALLWTFVLLRAGRRRDSPP